MRLSQGYQTDCNQNFQEIGIEISDKNYILQNWTILNNTKRFLEYFLHYQSHSWSYKSRFSLGPGNQADSAITHQTNELSALIHFLLKYVSERK